MSTSMDHYRPKLSSTCPSVRTARQNNALARVRQRLAAVQDFHPVYVSLGSKPAITARQHGVCFDLQQRTLSIVFSVAP